MATRKNKTKTLPERWRGDVVGVELPNGKTVLNTGGKATKTTKKK